MLNGDLIQAKIKIHSSCQTLINELMGLVWKTDGDKIRIPKAEHPSLPNHLCDAMLYAWRNGYHYYFKHAVPTKVMTDADHAEALMQNHVKKLQKEREIKDGQQYGGWVNDSNGVAPWNKWTD
jgi:hypothetical protein